MIQNADDEKATEIRFYFEKDARIVVTNNGRKFSRDDVRTICYAGHSLKKNKKGFFGIGFKSVKRVTDSPHIISGRFNFVIDDYYHPEPCNRIPKDVEFNSKKGAIFVLTSKSQEECDRVLERLLEETKEYLLLFLDRTRRIYIVDRRGEEEETYTLSYDLRRGILRNSFTGSESRWRVFKKTIDVPESILRPTGKEEVRETEMALAFPLGSEDPRPPQKLFCYLPTERLTGYAFVVQGDFLPILGRSNIDEDHPWNKHLLSHLPQLVGDAFEALKADSALRIRIMSFLPLEDRCHDELFSRYIEDIYENLKGKRTSYTRDKDFRTPRESVNLPHELWDLLNNDDLRDIYGSDKAAISDEYTESERDSLSLLGLDEFGPEDIQTFFSNGKNIKTKTSNPDWFVSVYSYVYENLDEFDKRSLMDIPILLSENGELVQPRDPIKTEKPRLIANQYMNRQTAFFTELFGKHELIFLHRAFRISRSQKRNKNYDPRLDKVHRLFETLGVIGTVEAHHIITRLILPRFEEVRDGKRMSYKRAVLFTKYIVENLSYYRSEYGRSLRKTDDWDIFSDIRSRILLIAEMRDSGGKKRNVFLPPVEVYRRGEKRRLLHENQFRSLTDVPFLSRKYFSKRVIGGFTSIPISGAKKRRKTYSWDDFFELMGCWDTPRVVCINRRYSRWDSRLKKDFSGVNWSGEYDSTRGYEFEDWTMPELTETVRKYNEEKDTAKRRRLKHQLVLIRESIARNWKKYQPFRRVQVFYFHYSPGDFKMDSSLLQELRRPWFPRSADGRLIPPSMVYVDTTRNRHLAPPGCDFIRIPSGSKEFYREIGVVEEPRPEDVLKRLQETKARWDSIRKIPSDGFRITESHYEYLIEKSEAEGDLKDAIEDVFSKKFLVFLPARVGGRMKLWWHRDQVFAAEAIDYSLKPHYQPLFQEGAYDTALAKVFTSLGVRGAPALLEYKVILERIKKEYGEASTDRKQELKGRIIYALEGLSRLIQDESTSDDDLRTLDESVFLTEKDEFPRPSETYLMDDDKIHNVFKDVVNTLWYNAEITSISSSLMRIGFKSLRSLRKRRKAKYVEKKAIHEDDQEKFREFCEIIEAFIENRFSTSYDEQRDNISRLEQLRIFTARNIKVAYYLDGKRRMRGNVSVFLSGGELAVSNADNDPWLEAARGDFSRCVASIFGPLSPHLEPLVNDLHQNPDDLDIVIKKWGLEKGPVFKKYVEDVSQVVKLPTAAEEPEVPEEYLEEEIGEVVDVVTKPPKAPTPESKEEEVFPIETIHGFIVKGIKTGKTTNIPVRRRKPRAQKRRRKKDISTTYTPFSSRMTEDIAVEVVRLFEQSQRRENVMDVREYDEEGCDLISSGKGGDRLIEIKASKGRRSNIKLRPSQYDRARKDKKKYYIYKVENLKKGSTPRIEIVKNPIDNPKIRLVHKGEVLIEGWETSDKTVVDVESKGG
ncbi:MAG: DUF3883 domain-containing protein [Thermoplasmata archaeon]|nr:DUF3883 domain-containing protein [Thermoplasmata archaeon]